LIGSFVYSSIYRNLLKLSTKPKALGLSGKVGKFIFLSSIFARGVEEKKCPASDKGKVHEKTCDFGSTLESEGTG
jgi:hypothetical protein